MGNGLSISQRAEIFGNSLTGFGKWLKYLENGLDIPRTAKIFQVRHKYVANDLNLFNMASMCGGRLKYLRNGFTMLEMT